MKTKDKFNLSKLVGKRLNTLQVKTEPIKNIIDAEYYLNRLIFIYGEDALKQMYLINGEFCKRQEEVYMGTNLYDFLSESQERVVV